MTEEKPVPPGGDAVPAESRPAMSGWEPWGGLGIEDPPADLPPADLPPISLLASGSTDDNFLASPLGRRREVAEAEPDHSLAQLDSPTSGGSANFPLPAEPGDPALVSKSASEAGFPALNLGAAPASEPSTSAGVAEAGPAEEWDEEIIEERRTPWATVLLASYSSAITLAFGWTLWKDRSREKADAVAVPSAVAPPEPARQSSLSRKVVPPEPILGEHLATIGKPLQVGSLEVTPVEVRRDNVVLQHSTTFATPERRDGGKKALTLKLKLKNTSTDAVFAPLDQAYLRERGKDIVDTYVDTGSGERVYPYHLALDSEWSIVGQDFTELRPGESRIVLIVSAPDAPPDEAGPFTWRVRLRTGIDRTDVIGVRWPDVSSKPK